MPGVIAAIQTFGDRINAHPHLHFLVTEGGVDETGLFHKVPRIDDSRLASLFAREVLSNLVGRELLSPEWADRLLSWRHTGFNVHSRVRARTKAEAERVGKYMIRPLLSLERLSFLEVCVQFVSVATGPCQLMFATSGPSYSSLQFAACAARKARLCSRASWIFSRLI